MKINSHSNETNLFWSLILTASFCSFINTFKTLGNPRQNMTNSFIFLMFVSEPQSRLAQVCIILSSTSFNPLHKVSVPKCIWRPWPHCSCCCWTSSWAELLQPAWLMSQKINWPPSQCYLATATSSLNHIWRQWPTIAIQTELCSYSFPVAIMVLTSLSPGQPRHTISTHCAGLTDTSRSSVKDWRRVFHN